MTMLSIMFIITVFVVVVFNSYCIAMAIKYRNLKNLYKIKNRIAYINTNFSLLMEHNEIKKYPNTLDLLDNLIKNINKLSNIKSIYSFRISNKKNFLEKNSIIYKNLEEEFKLLKQNNDTEIIDVVIDIIKFDYLVFKIKSPIKYFFEVYLKKILPSRILCLIVKILNKIKYFAEKSNIQNDVVENIQDFNINFNIIEKRNFF